MKPRNQTRDRHSGLLALLAASREPAARKQRSGQCLLHHVRARRSIKRRL